MKEFNNYPPIMIDRTIAKNFGLKEAIILNVINNNYMNKSKFEFNKQWTKISYNEMQKRIPFLSINIIKRKILKLEKMRILESKNLNSQKIDKTKSYWINEKMINDLLTK